MLKYAREDTHYLLYIYDEIRKKVVLESKESNLSPIESLKSVLNKSKTICLKTYKKPILKSENYYNIMNRNKPLLSRRKYKVLKTIFKWRDSVARLEDENPGFILPMNLMLEVMELNPKTPNELYSKIKKINYITKRHIPKLIEDIQKVNEKLKEERTIEEKKKIGTTFGHQAPSTLPPTRNFHQFIVDTELSENEKFKMGTENVSFGHLEDQKKQSIKPHDYHNVNLFGKN